MAFKYVGHDARYAVLRAASIFAVRGYGSGSPDLHASVESMISATGFQPSALDSLHPSTISDGVERVAFNRLRCVNHLLSRTRLALSRRQAYQLCRVIVAGADRVRVCHKARHAFQLLDSDRRSIPATFIPASDRVVDPRRDWDSNASDHFPGVLVWRVLDLDPWHREYITNQVRAFFADYWDRVTYVSDSPWMKYRNPDTRADQSMADCAGYGDFFLLCKWCELGAAGKISGHPYADIFRDIVALWESTSGPGRMVGI
jgi:hypothetical protein